MRPFGMEGGCQEREMERDEVGKPTILKGGPSGAEITKYIHRCDYIVLPSVSV